MSSRGPGFSSTTNEGGYFGFVCLGFCLFGLVWFWVLGLDLNLILKASLRACFQVFKLWSKSICILGKDILKIVLLISLPLTLNQASFKCFTCMELL